MGHAAHNACGLSVTKGSLCCLSYRSTIGADSGSSTRLVWLGTRCLSARPCPHDSGRECRNRTGLAGHMRLGFLAEDSEIGAPDGTRTRISPIENRVS